MVDMLNSPYDGCSNNYLVDGGDMIEAITIDDPRYSAEKSGEPPLLDQIDEAIKLREPIKDKLLCILQGNHERKLWRLGDITQKVCDKLGVDYGTYCVSSDTEILTDEGWKKYGEIGQDDKALAYDLGTGNLLWQKIDKVDTFSYTGDMIRIKTKCLDILMTPNHRNLVRTQNKKHIIRVAGDLKITDKIIVAGNYKAPLGSSYSDELVQLIGWIVTEGWLRKNAKCKTYTIKIAQAKLRGQKRIEELLLKMGIMNHVLKRVQPSGLILKDYYIPAKVRDQVLQIIPHKQLTVAFLKQLTMKQLQLLYDVVVEADGSRDKSGVVVIQKAGVTADAIQILGILLGKQANCYEKKGSDKVLTISMTQRIYRTIDEKHPNKTKEYYQGIVWCPELKLGTWVARRNGKVFITGNTAKISIVSSKDNLMYKIYETHGLRTISNVANDPIARQANEKIRIKNLMKNQFSDCAVMVRHHSHRVIVAEPTKELYLYDDGKKIKQGYTGSQQNAEYIDPNARWYANAGSLMRLYVDGMSGYAEVAEYRPTELGFVVTVVRNGRIIRVDPVYLNI